MSSKTATIRFKNGEKWDEFLKSIEENNGTTRGYIGLTVENLIELYLNDPNITIDTINKLRETNKKLQEKIDFLEKDHAENDTAQLEEENKKLQDDINITHAKYDELEIKYNQIQERYSEIEELNRTINSEKIDLQNKNIELSSKIEFPEQENKLLQKNYDLLEENYTQLREDNKNINEIFKTINEDLKQQQKDTRRARNDYRHIVERLNKLQEEYNNLQNENKNYRVLFAEIKKMSLRERVLGKYPNNIKELSQAPEDEEKTNHYTTEHMENNKEE
ncbi:hypothetical protein [Methanosphaera sp. WGK6]|uniref:hypothetical protein n=1 Tax=Methanosphaera sp. WGK6 TaxID=1561964 RepID=UPI00084BF478|nr:hypothetical protein [Methanosphaera sp. WGK6]OED30263.1 hypothetical protein NL43_03805 [Methanosphaera sp. WGK6]